VTTPKAIPKTLDSAPQLVGQCLGALESMGSLQGWRWNEAHKHDDLVDGHLELRIAGSRTKFAVAIRPAVRETHLGPLAHLRTQLTARDERLLVCTRRITSRLAASLRELGIGYLDTAGTAWFEGRGVLVQVTGRAASKQHSLRARLTGGDLRLLHVLLRVGGTADRNHRQLAEAAGIALGAVGKALRALDSRGLLRQRGASRQDIADPTVAQAEFAEGWATVMRRKLDARGYRAIDPHRIERLPLDLARLGDRCLLGGELAAAAITGALQTQHATLHVPAGAHGEIAAALDLVADADGPVTLVERFGSGDGVLHPERRDLWLAHPLLIHAELVAIGDERLAPAVEGVWRWWLALQGGGSGG